jgi:benzoate-CoA ligase family protein
MIEPRFPEQFNIADYFLFDRLAEGRGERVAVRYGARHYTYAEVAERALAVARYLAAAGVDREQRVLVVLPDTPPFVWALFGVLRRGAVLAMGNPDAPPADLAYLIAYTRAAAVVTTPEVATALASSLRAAPGLRCLLLVPGGATGADPEAAVSAPAPLQETEFPVLSLGAAIARGRQSGGELPQSHRDDVCVWLFTSGSTGQAKAAVHCHRDFAYNTEVYARGTVGYRESDVTLSVPRLFFGYATGTNLWFPFAVGATVVLFSERPTAELLARLIHETRPTIVTNVPTMLGKLLDHDERRRAAGEPGLDLSSVRFHLSAGEALPPPLLERFMSRFGTDVYDGIGSAEMFHIYVSNRPGDIRPGSLGRPVDGYQVAVLPQDAAGPGAPPLPPGETGVLWVKGDSVAMAYHQDRDRSFATFHGHWCRTGDLVRMDEAGYLWFAGRADELFKASGIWVAPLEVEECLMRHPAVSLAAVIPAERDGLTRPKALIVLRPEQRPRCADAEGRAALTAELREHCHQLLAHHKAPRWLLFVDDLPRNDRGKVDRKALRQKEVAGELPWE